MKEKSERRRMMLEEKMRRRERDNGKVCICVTDEGYTWVSDKNVIGCLFRRLS